MPRYYYHCNKCHSDFFVYHMMSEIQKECTSCLLTDVSKLLTKPLYFDSKTKKALTGDVTKQHIEDNRKLLDDMKREVREKEYKEEKS